jgi:hypothetical protein
VAHNFSTYYNRRCQRMMFELAGVINPSCPAHTNIFV